jgi:hypothetical protein
MNRYETNYEKQISANIDKLMGEKDPDLKEIIKLSLIYQDEHDDEGIKEKNKLIEKIKRNNQYEVDDIFEKMKYTYDNEGKLIPLTEYFKNLHTIDDNSSGTGERH